MKNSLLLLFFLVLMTGCKKPSDSALEYIGTWHASGGCDFTDLTIYEDNTGCFFEGIYKVGDGGCKSSLCGKVSIAALGLYINASRFELVSRPKLIEAPIYKYSKYYQMELKTPVNLGSKKLVLIKYIY